MSTPLAKSVWKRDAVQALSPAIFALLFLFSLERTRRFRKIRLVVCNSDAGRVFCDTDTRGGGRWIRQFQDSEASIQGESWGDIGRAIWVDMGCSGEFALGNYPQASTTIEPQGGDRRAHQSNDRCCYNLPSVHGKT